VNYSDFVESVVVVVVVAVGENKNGGQCVVHQLVVVQKSNY